MNGLYVLGGVVLIVVVAVVLLKKNKVKKISNNERFANADGDNPNEPGGKDKRPG